MVWTSDDRAVDGIHYVHALLLGEWTLCIHYVHALLLVEWTLCIHYVHTHTYAYTHTHTYIYICIYVYIIDQNSSADLFASKDFLEMYTRKFCAFRKYILKNNDFHCFLIESQLFEKNHNDGTTDIVFYIFIISMFFWTNLVFILIHKQLKINLFFTYVYVSHIY